MGGGRYSTVTPTVTQEVKDKERKVKNSHLSLTQTVTVGVAGTLPLQPDKTMEDLASRPPTEDALRQLGLTFSSLPTDHAVGQLGFDSSIGTTDHAVRQPGLTFHWHQRTMPGKRASPRRTQQVGCLGLWLGEHHHRRLRLLSIDRGKGSLGWTEPIVLLSRGRPLNSGDPEGVRAPDHPPKPRSGPSHPFRRSNGRCRPPAWFDLSIDPTDLACASLV
jgi:hypothetical protein